jgi:hypothetical protein
MCIPLLPIRATCPAHLILLDLIKPSKKPTLKQVVSKAIAQLFFDPERAPPKRRLTFSALHAVIPQDTLLLIATAFANDTVAEVCLRIAPGCDASCVTWMAGGSVFLWQTPDMELVQLAVRSFCLNSEIGILNINLY